MRFVVLVEPVAESEWREGANWYEEREPGLGLRFNRAVKGVLRTLSRDPNRFPAVSRRVRRARMIGWPYSAYFVVDQEARRVTVVAVWQGNGNPSELRQRIQ